MKTLDAVLSRINAKRLWDCHEEIARFGMTAKGGVNRQALSDEEIDARRRLLEWATEIGANAYTDDVGNFFIRLEGRISDAAPVLLGSHIDSQPTGGKYDGIYGVLAGLEVLRAVKEAGVTPNRPIEVVAWMNEEGSRFAPGMMGSAVFCGARQLKDVVSVVDAKGIGVADELERVAKAFPDVTHRRLGFPVHCYFEAHIEQGPVLEVESKVIGVVTGIQGKRTYSVDVKGEEGHAGTTPQSKRRDALTVAAGLVVTMNEAFRDEADITRFTVGRFTVSPNAPSVIPGLVSFSIDLRHPDAQILSTHANTIPYFCRIAKGHCEVKCDPLVNDAPIAFPQEMQCQIAEAADHLGFSSMSLLSAAGHDAKFLATICPSGMIFIPCKDGISHNEAESVIPEHVAAGAAVLCEVAYRQAGVE